MYQSSAPLATFRSTAECSGRSSHGPNYEMSAAGATRAESHDRAMGVALSKSSRATLRRPSTVTSQVLPPALLHVAVSFPDHHLSKSDSYGAHETRTPHLALGAGGTFKSLPDSETARRTLRSAPPCIQPCTESS
jgi:hypothetical protein